MLPADVSATGLYYLNPDVIADLSEVECFPAGLNRVRVFGTKGYLLSSSSDKSHQRTLRTTKNGLLTKFS